MARQIFQEGVRQSRSRDEETQERHVEERTLGAQGQEPQAGNCDRVVGSAARRQEGAAAEILEETQRLQKTKIEPIGALQPILQATRPDPARGPSLFVLINPLSVAARRNDSLSDSCGDATSGAAQRTAHGPCRMPAPSSSA